MKYYVLLIWITRICIYCIRIFLLSSESYAIDYCLTLGLNFLHSEQKMVGQLFYLIITDLKCQVFS